jgi:YHS domain-containing protein
MSMSVPRIITLLSLVAAAPLLTLQSLGTATASTVQAPSSDVAIGGYCPVAYIAMKQAMKGSAAHASVHKGKTYHLTNADAKKMFDAAPDTYVPAYDGWCATAVAQGTKLKSDPTLYTVHDGRAYLFSNKAAKAMFDKDPKGTVAKADAAWATLSR